MVLENTQFELMYQNDFFILYIISPMVPEMISQIQSNPFPLANGIFKKKYLADFLKMFPPDL